MTDDSAVFPPENANGDRTYESLGLLADLSAEFAASMNIGRTLDAALNRITDYLEAAGGALFLLDDEGEFLRCEACVGETDITGITIKAGDGIVGRSVAGNAGEIIRNARDDPGFDSSVDAKTGFTTKSILCAPLSVREERIGAIELINKKSGDGLFDDQDLSLLRALSTSAALAILNVRMAAELVEQERVRRELELAAEIQRNLLPTSPGAGFPVHGVNIPAREVSGDFYDFFELDDGRIAFSLGDVSGKGMNAALLMAKAASLYRCLGKTLFDPGRLLAVVNREICETATRGMFITMIGGLLDPATGSVRLANAGHEPPLIQGPDGGFRALPADAPPIGISLDIVDDSGFPETEIGLDGGTLYIFTDGVTESHQEGGGMLGVEGFKSLIAAASGLPLGERLANIVASIRGGDLHDDLTILAIDAGTRERAEIILDLRIPARAAKLKEIRGAVREAAVHSGCSDNVAADIVIAVDEACQNIIRHAYGGECDEEIHLNIERQGERLKISLRDDAEPIDAATVKPRDLEDIKPGGLGTHFINEVMDTVEFTRPADQRGNLLIMTKKMG